MNEYRTGNIQHTCMATQRKLQLNYAIPISQRVARGNVYERNNMDSSRANLTHTEEQGQSSSFQNLTEHQPQTFAEAEWRQAVIGGQDLVDGDEPGLIMDPELERLSQPHVLMAQPRYERFADYQVRERTFMSWKKAFPAVHLLIMSGFFFLGGADNVQCFHCGIILHSWEESDVPDDEHRKHAPNCAFIQNKREASRQVDHRQQVDLHYLDDDCTPSPRRLYERTPEEHEAALKKTITGLGHTDLNIEKAMNKLKLEEPEVRRINSDMVLDTLYDLESIEDTSIVEEFTYSKPDDRGATGGAEVSSGDKPTAAPENTSSTKELFNADSKGIIAKASKLERENEELKKQTTCRVCWENPSTELFLPCGHLACCASCSGRLLECPYCREKILRTVRVFLP